MEKYGGDPYEPLSARHLMAAIKLERRSFDSLATQVGCSKQNLHHLAHRGRRCRVSLKRKLAAALTVPEGWLVGGEGLPWPTVWLEHYRLRRRRKGGGGNRLPPTALLASWRLLERCARAIKREYRRRPDLDPGSIEDSLVNLLSPGLWRTLLLELGPADHILRDKELDEIVPLLVTCLDVILRPWIDGRTSMKLDRLTDLERMMGLPVPRDYGHVFDRIGPDRQSLTGKRYVPGARKLSQSCSIPRFKA